MRCLPGWKFEGRTDPTWGLDAPRLIIDTTALESSQQITSSKYKGLPSHGHATKYEGFWSPREPTEPGNRCDLVIVLYPEDVSASQILRRSGRCITGTELEAIVTNGMTKSWMEGQPIRKKNKVTSVYIESLPRSRQAISNAPCGPQSVSERASDLTYDRDRVGPP
jgi:hypothetical protein